MIYFNKFTQGIYDSVPFTTINLPDMDENIDTIHLIIDSVPKSLVHLTYIAEDDKAVIDLIFQGTRIPARTLVQKLYNKVFNKSGIDSYTQRVIGDHTYLTCEISL